MELKQKDMLREIYRSNLILDSCKTYNLYTKWLVPRDSKVKRILSSDWLPSEKGPVLSAGNFPLNLVPSTLVPKVFLEIFLRERESEQRSGDESRSSEEREKNVFLSLFAASRLAVSFAKKNFKENLWDQGIYVPTLFTYEETNERTRFFFRFSPGRKSSLGRIINPLLTRSVRSRWQDIVPFFSSSSFSIKTQKRAWPIGSLIDAHQLEMRPSPFKFTLTLPNLYC